MNETYCRSVWNKLEFVTCNVMYIPGVIGSILVTVVIHSKMKRNNPNFLLKIISIMYMCMLAVFIIWDWTQFFLDGKRPKQITTSLYFLFGFIRFATEWIMVYITCVRTVAFTFPEKAKTMWSDSVVYGFILTILLTGMILQIPSTIFYNAKHDNQSAFMSYNYSTHYQFFYNVICVGMLPMVLLSLSLLMMIIKTKSLRNNSAMHNGYGILDQIKSINKLMIAKVAILICCHLPISIYMVVYLTLHFLDKDMANSLTSCWYYCWYQSAYTVIGINASCQLVIYVTLSGKFRRGLHSIFQ